MAKEPDLVELVQVSPTEVEFRGRRLTYFGGSDYFRLSWNVQVRRAVIQAARRWGHNVAAGRTTTGNHPVYDELEKSLARYFHFPSAVVASNGYLAPSLAAQGFGGRFTHALLSDAAHGCLQDAALLSGLPVVKWSPLEDHGLDRAMSKCGSRSRPVVFSTGLSPLQGTLPPLDRWLDRLPPDAGLLLDDAHGLGTLGEGGRGALGDIRDPRVILTGTLSKAIGAYGGFVLGPGWLREQILTQSRMFQGSTPLPPPLAYGALAALKLLERHGPVWRRELARRVQWLREALETVDAGRPRAPGPAFTFAPEDDKSADRLRRRLLKSGIFPSRIRYAQGPADRFYRFAVSTAHTWDQLGRLQEVLVGKQNR